MEVNNKVFSGFKRVFRSENCEYWRAVFLDDTGLVDEDDIVLLWEDENIRGGLFSADAARLSSIQYYDLILGLFHNLATYSFKFIRQEKPVNYSIEEQIENLKKEFTAK